MELLTHVQNNLAITVFDFRWGLHEFEEQRKQVCKGAAFQYCGNCLGEYNI